MECVNSDINLLKRDTMMSVYSRASIEVLACLPEFTTMCLGFLFLPVNQSVGQFSVDCQSTNLFQEKAGGCGAPVGTLQGTNAESLLLTC